MSVALPYIPWRLCGLAKTNEMEDLSRKTPYIGMYFYVS